MNKSLRKFKPASAQFEFKEYPFYWIVRLGNRYTQVMEKELKKVGINITSWRVGLILREYGQISMSEIATHAVGRLPTITKTVYRMQEKGLVKVTTNNTDGRVTMVSITKQGVKMIEDMIQKTERIINRSFEGLSAKDAKQLNGLLQQVFDNLA